ncbi:MAG: diguanylate cyclase, partial [Lachnospiraceae bacterium]|nr:diguanylate cyclase [Lachnospiraceae bacterium]
MGGLLNKVKGLLFMRVNEGEESDTLALLLRGSSLLMMVYALIMFIWCSLNGRFATTKIVEAVSFFIFAFILYLTYSGGVRRALFIYHYALFFLGSVGSYIFSWRSGFSFFILIGMLSMYFDLRTRSLGKRIISLTDVAVLILLIHLTYKNSDPVFLDSFMIMVNTVSEIGLVIIVGNSFSYKFAKAESQLFSLNRELKKMANSDPLTGLMNRRCILDIMEEIVEGYNNGGNLVSVAIGDIDFFKKVNDTYGH